MTEKMVDHVSILYQEALRKYVFVLDRLVEKEKLLSFVSKSARSKRQLAGFKPEILNYLYLSIAKEIENEFNVHVKIYVHDGIFA